MRLPRYVCSHMHMVSGRTVVRITRASSVSDRGSSASAKTHPHPPPTPAMPCHAASASVETCLCTLCIIVILLDALSVRVPASLLRSLATLAGWLAGRLQGACRCSPPAAHAACRSERCRCSLQTMPVRRLAAVECPLVHDTHRPAVTPLLACNVPPAIP